MRKQKERPLGWAPLLAAGWIALGLTLPIQGEADEACKPIGFRQTRVTPRNAGSIPGVTTEGYPEIGRAQKIEIGREVLGSSISALLTHPLRSTTQVVGRATERLAVRARELTILFGSSRPADRYGQVGDGIIDSPFGTPRMPARITLLPSSEQAIRELLALIASAERRVDLMMYGWEDDPTGREVALALANAARRGVRVRAMADRGAFLMHNPPAAQGKSTFLDGLRIVPGVEVIESPDPFFRFDHRKLAVIDGRTAWSGGMILTEVARRSWENLAFLAEGPVVTQYAALFEDRWQEVGGAPGGPVLDASTRSTLLANASVRMVRTDVRERSLKNALFHAIDHARHHIYLENPYFSDEIFAEKLVSARKRGVDVRVVVTLRGNVKRLNQYVILTSNRLLRGGVRVYLAPFMTHVKAMSVDGTWSYLGTGNFDELSLRNNREVALAVTSPQVTGELDQRIFLPDLAMAEELHALMPLPRNWPLLELFALWY
ncbi:MAG: hypothetical protein NVSMB9_23120 [Isosphaeraceae bacterium]